MSRIKNQSVKTVFDGFPPGVQKRLLLVRDLILSTASKIEAVGRIEETLKWGEPAYLTSESKSGSTIRLGWKESWPDEYSIYFNCRTSLVDTFRTLYPELTYQGNRAIVFAVDADVSREVLVGCFEISLTYHLTKRTAHSRKITA